MSFDVDADEIVVSEHAADRWDQRTPPTSIAPETAWGEALPVGVSSPRYRNLDEIRYHTATETLLFRDATRIVTVYERDESQPSELWETVDRQYATDPGGETA